MADQIELSRPDFMRDAGAVAPRGRAGGIVAAALALAASAGLAWWTLSPDREAAAPPPNPMPAPSSAAPVAPQPLRYASDEPDPAQVKRAHADVQAAYVAGGPQALVRASAACARQVPAAPDRLDYCLGLDTYAREIVSAAADPAAADWFADQGRDLALARTALPGGSDAGNRLDQVQALAQAVLPKPVVERPRPQAQAQGRAQAEAASKGARQGEGEAQGQPAARRPAGGAAHAGLPAGLGAKPGLGARFPLPAGRAVQRPSALIDARLSF